MGEITKVEWCSHTLGLWVGCTKVSAECKFCYAEVETYPRVQRHRGRELWGINAERHITSDAQWRLPLKWSAEALALHERRRVFVNSMADFFELRMDLVGPRKRAWEIFRFCRSLDFLLLTKRPENIPAMLPFDWGTAGWPNIWLGTSVGVRDTLWRLDELRKVSAPVRFVSFEPLLEDLGELNLDGIDWAIIGGESGGPHARPMDIDWARRIIEQCRVAGTAVFFKQAGRQPVTSTPNGLVHLRTRHKKGGDLAELPEEFRIREFPTPRFPQAAASSGGVGGQK